MFTFLHEKRFSYSCCFSFRGNKKNTVNKHLHTECYCLRMVERCVYLSMKLIPINNKLNGVCTIDNNSHTQTLTPMCTVSIRTMTARNCGIKVSMLSVWIFVCASIIQTKNSRYFCDANCLFLDHNLMSKDNHVKLFEWFTAIDVFKSDWKSSLWPSVSVHTH